MKSFFRGIEDHSIRPFEDPALAATTVGHCLMAMAQRIMPREPLFIEEHGYGQEMLRCQVKLMLAALRQY